MATTFLRVLKPFLFADYATGSTGPYYTIKVDQSIAQMNLYVDSNVAVKLQALGVCATGVTGP